MSSENTDTKTRILNAAWSLLEGPQAGNVRMGDIAKKAGVSRQALYLHFPTRAELLIATTRHIDVVKDMGERLAESRSANTGRARLRAFIDAWGNYIPEIYGVGRALLAVMDTDEAAAVAWQDRMQAVREGCAAAIQSLEESEELSPDFASSEAVDILWALLSVRTWEHFTQNCGWPQDRYITRTKQLAERVLVKPAST